MKYIVHFTTGKTLTMAVAELHQRLILLEGKHHFTLGIALIVLRNE